MAIRTVSVIHQLRRDNDFNYQDTFVPYDGELCFVDTAADGLRFKVGDGATTWANLPYVDKDAPVNPIVKGYFFEGQFYSDAAHTTLITPSTDALYVDLVLSAIYTYNGTQYVAITQSVSLANAETAGIMKLYSETGANTDGTMTQKVVTDKLNEKVGVETSITEETLTFLIG